MLAHFVADFIIWVTGRTRVTHPLLKRVVAQTVGTAMLLAAVVCSSIMGERLHRFK